MADAQTPANVQHDGKAEPDPSVSTLQTIWREIAHTEKVIDLKIAAIDKAVALAHADAERFPTDIDKAIGHLQDKYDERFKAVNLALAGEHNLKEEKFNKVEQRFQLIETTRTEQKAEAAHALITALSAVKEANTEYNKTNQQAINKSELTTSKQLEGLDSKINDLKERVTRIESVSTGKKDFWGYIIGGISLIGMLATIIAMIVRNSTQ